MVLRGSGRLISSTTRSSSSRNGTRCASRPVCGEATRLGRRASRSSSSARPISARLGAKTSMASATGGLTSRPVRKPFGCASVLSLDHRQDAAERPGSEASRGRGRSRRGAGTPAVASSRSSVGFVMKPISTRITGTSAQLKPVKSERSWSPRSGKPSAARRSRLHEPRRTLARRVDVVGPPSAERRVQRVRPARGAVGRAVGMDAEEERSAGAVRDSGASDVPDARARRLRPRHDDPDPRPLEERPQAQRDTQVEVRLP